MWSKNAFTLGTLLLCAWGDVSLSRCCAGYYHQHASTLATITSKKKCLCSQSLLFFQRRACGIFSSLQWASSVALLIFFIYSFCCFYFCLLFPAVIRSTRRFHQECSRQRSGPKIAILGIYGWFVRFRAVSLFSQLQLTGSGESCNIQVVHSLFTACTSHSLQLVQQWLCALGA